MTRAVPTAAEWRERLRADVADFRARLPLMVEHGLPVVRRLRVMVDLARLARDYGAAAELRELLAGMGYDSRGHRLASVRGVPRRDCARGDSGCRVGDAAIGEAP